MPIVAPIMKVQSCRQFGANIIIHVITIFPTISPSFFSFLFFLLFLLLSVAKKNVQEYFDD